MDQTEPIYKECNALLMAMLGRKELVEQWWHSVNKGFDGAHPADVDPQKVREYLISKAYGEW
jgi:hypothetical protein